MKILDFVKPELMVPELRATSKDGILGELATHIASQLGGEVGLGAAALQKILTEREKLASTAIGEGVAIPHGKLSALPRLIGCVGRAPRGVDFDSMDGRPTYIFFVLLAPESSTGIHLKALARISRLFKDAEFRQRLIDAPGSADMFRVLSDEDAKY